MEMQDRVRQDIERLGEKTTAQLLYFAPVVRMVTELRPTDNDIVWLATAFHIISSYASQDPTPFHFVLSRDCLIIKNIIDDRAVHMLASELVIHCKRLHEFISDPFSKENDRRPVIRLQDDKGFFIPVRDAMPEFVCELDECNRLDLLLAEFLRSIGARGLEAAEYIEKTAKDSFKPYRESGYETIHRPAAWSLWITPSPNASIFIGAMEILAEVVWIDVCQKRWERSIQYPATPKAVLRTAIRPPLMPGARVEIVENNIRCFSEDGREVAFVPAVGQGHITIISRGLKGMSSLAGHQIIRWLIESGFKNWAAFKQDPRLIEVDGGYSRICEFAGCGSSKTTRSSVKAILFGMEYSQFCFPNGTKGSLISTAVKERFRTTDRYGCAVVVPMRDIDGKLWSYQLLNGDRSKINQPGGRTLGLCHILKPIIDGKAFGIAEGYASASTCLELLGIPMVCAFGSSNIKSVAIALSGKYPNSRVVLFADNDRVGLQYSQAAASAIGDRAIVTAPDFGDRPPAKDESDWNDLVRIAGKEATLNQLNRIFQGMPNSS